ncbi:hypothetical protein MPF_2041 [Methanohalophilus portucalensis FDF-1]|uniref:Uncharacterized protein n=1 Tax=Methanohalophilus portucalensis FDF-1 TaxID=523843 RepID=A0A1L9C1Z4_9EURY|nr:hypothetical protein MPF_2041 [Methanohalophilus portucalensis FDF-1]
MRGPVLIWVVFFHGYPLDILLPKFSWSSRWL